MVFLRHIDEAQLLDRQCNEAVKRGYTEDKVAIVMTITFTAMTVSNLIQD
jgi:hypothetical protein